MDSIINTKELGKLSRNGLLVFMCVTFWIPLGDYVDNVTDEDYDNFAFIRIMKDAKNREKAIEIAYSEILEAAESGDWN